MCLGFLFEQIIQEKNKIGNSGFLGWLSSLRTPVACADLTNQLSHPLWVRKYLTLSGALKMSPTVSDVSVVYQRAGSAHVLFWALCIAQVFASQLPFISNKCWSKGERNTEQHHPRCRWTSVLADPGPLIPLWEGRKGFTWRRFQGVQSPLREMLSVRLGEEPVWLHHHPSQPCRLQGVTPVEESSWRGQS